MDTATFDTETALEAALALSEVLSARTHRKQFMGQEVIIPGQLGEALQLPLIIQRLRGKQARQREAGLAAFLCLWPTLSARTQERVLEQIGWYDPQVLSWDDKRSNRRPATDVFDDPLE
ncbi:hypothetical protein [Marinobacter sp. X15-166B]|uniref:hypothetical protein n=1 Tax=Marinobacter sp. X15-166B TaxID=1897620 RepID=UPI00085C0C98|nr:hypothetical protein [Marinobacter sp. X15-166B]OEY66719.1 hypothetical protein BG841_09815 [Marinobacter sp. X15-166B]